MKTKYIVVFVAIFAIFYIFFAENKVFNTDLPVTSKHDLTLSLPTVSIPSIQLPDIGKNLLADKAWSVFENYLNFAHNHDISGVQSLSYQISDTCKNPESETACFGLMDSLYEIASPLKRSEFTHIQSDERQIVMFTDGPVVVILYFIRKGGAPKILGLSYCIENEDEMGQCVETDPVLRDEDNNGWWDSVERLFYIQPTQ